MRIVVVGSIVADTIEHAAGGVTESLGGIAHTVSALSAMGGDQYTIIPVCRVGKDCRQRVTAWAEPLAGVSLEAVTYMNAPNPRVQLSYGATPAAGERVERLRDVPPPLDVDAVAAAETADLVMVNCITGADCTAAAMRAVRAACPRVYLDVHSLALGATEGGERFYRGRDDWSAWLGSADVVQCNQAEAATILELRHEVAAQDEVVAGVARHIGVGAAADSGAAGPAGAPRVWLLTLGAGGAVVFQRGEHADAPLRVGAPRVHSIDPTGAGDAFGAGYVCAWLAGKAPAAAARAAVRSGSAACTTAGVPSADVFDRSGERIEGG